jgi:hypothetical protein
MWKNEDPKLQVYYGRQALRTIEPGTPGDRSAQANRARHDVKGRTEPRMVRTRSRERARLFLA